MLPDEPPDPSQVPASPPGGPGWHERSGLTLREAEELLDWLEANGVAEREVTVTEAGVTVRWRA